MICTGYERTHPLTMVDAGGKAGVNGRDPKGSLVDCHAHLEQLKDLPEALSEAREEGIRGIVAVGMDKASNERTLRIARDHPRFVYPAIGYHPWAIQKSEVDETLLEVREQIGSCVALGEVGLDYKIKVRKGLQQEVLSRLLDFAGTWNKPVILHCRLSHRRVLEMVRRRGLKKALFHWYSGPQDVLQEILAEGYFISATPALLYSPPHQEAIRLAPLARILLETDCPVRYQTLEARPKDVMITLGEVARLKGIDPLLVAEETTANASQFFGISF